MYSLGLRLPAARRISDALFVLVTLLVLMSLAGQIAKYEFGHTQLKGLVPLFYVDNEPSVPTWYSSIAWALAGALTAVVAAAKFQLQDRFRWHWASLALLVCGLSLDEIAMIHEIPIDPMREAFNWDGLLHYAWVVPGIAFVAIVGLIYLRFFLSLPTRIRFLIAFAAIVFISGAIGTEMLSGVQAHRAGEENLEYALIVTIEEFCEMLGVVIFIRGLLEYIEGHLGKLELSFTRSQLAEV